MNNSINIIKFIANACFYAQEYLSYDDNGDTVNRIDDVTHSFSAMATCSHQTSCHICQYFKSYGKDISVDSDVVLDELLGEPLNQDQWFDIIVSKVVEASVHA